MTGRDLQEKRACCAICGAHWIEPSHTGMLLCFSVCSCLKLDKDFASEISSPVVRRGCLLFMQNIHHSDKNSRNVLIDWKELMSSSQLGGSCLTSNLCEFSGCKQYLTFVISGYLSTLLTAWKVQFNAPKLETMLKVLSAEFHRNYPTRSCNAV